MIVLTIDEINLCNVTKFNIEQDEDITVITVPVSDIHVTCKLHEKNTPVKGYQIHINGILLGYFHLISYTNIFPSTELEFRAHL